MMKMVEKMYARFLAPIKFQLILDNKPFDVVLCYFLLHELPDVDKRRAVNVLLDKVAPGGKVVFIDYHNPRWWHPLKPITSLVFDTLEPFAKTLWRKPLRDLCSNAEQYDWQQTTFFGGLYQKVVVQHK